MTSLAAAVAAAVVVAVVEVVVVVVVLHSAELAVLRWLSSGTCLMSFACGFQYLFLTNGTLTAKEP